MVSLLSADPRTRTESRCSPASLKLPGTRHSAPPCRWQDAMPPPQWWNPSRLRVARSPPPLPRWPTSRIRANSAAPSTSLCAELVAFSAAAPPTPSWSHWIWWSAVCRSTRPSTRIWCTDSRSPWRRRAPADWLRAGSPLCSATRHRWDWASLYGLHNRLEANYMLVTRSADLNYIGSGLEADKSDSNRTLGSLIPKLIS